MRKILTYALVSLFALSCTAQVDEQIGTDESALHGWGPKSPKKPDYHWASDNLNPTLRDLTVGYNVPQTVADWNGLGAPLQMVEVTSGTGEIEVIEDGDLNSGWLGLAQVWLTKDGHITKGRVSMNTTLLDADYSHLANAKMHVLCQEVGHVEGLTHNRDDLDTCMNDCTTAKTLAEWESCINHPDGVSPNNHDGEQLLVSYDGHSDGAGGSDDGGKGGPCKKNPNHPLCQEGWVTVHIFNSR